MAGQLKEVRNRIKSIQNSQQITKAMKMVSAAKLRRAQELHYPDAPLRSKAPGTAQQYRQQLRRRSGLQPCRRTSVEKVLLIVITSDRGLAGGL